MRDTHHLLKSWNWYSKEAWEEKPTFRDTTTSFHAKWFLTNERRNSILMTCRYPDLGNASDWSCRVGNLLFSRGNQWWGRKMLTAFPGYGNNWRIQLSNTQFIKGIRGGNTPAYIYFIFSFLFYFFSINPIGLVGGFEFTVFFFKEIWKNGRRGHGRMSLSAKGKQQK